MSLLSLDKYLHGPESAPSAHKPEAVTGYFGFSGSLIDTVRSALVGEALADIAKSLDSLQASLRPDCEPNALNQSAQHFHQLYGQFRDRLKKADQDRADEFRTVLGILNETMGYLSSGSRNSDSRFQKLEDSLQVAAKMDDLRTLRTHLGKVLHFVRQEASREREQTRGMLEFLGNQIRDSQQAAERLGSGIAPREEAIADLEALLGEGADSGAHATLFVADALKRMSTIHGNGVSDKLLEDLTRKQIQPMAPNGRVFRWSPISLLLLWRSDEAADAQETDNGSNSLFEYQTFIGTRLLTFKVAVRSLLLRMHGGLDDIVCILDNFAA